MRNSSRSHVCKASVFEEGALKLIESTSKERYMWRMVGVISVGV
jgi:hypothetical protein